ERLGIFGDGFIRVPSSKIMASTSSGKWEIVVSRLFHLRIQILQLLDQLEPLSGDILQFSRQQLNASPPILVVLLHYISLCCMGVWMLMTDVIDIVWDKYRTLEPFANVQLLVLVASKKLQV
ncbi:hypothetical protein FIBSPDRAFT_906168, partial [Athelia psychrophila]